MADNKLSNPGSPGAGTNFPENMQLLTFEEFAGLNTKATRPGIKDQEYSWGDNWMPLGPKNLRTLPDIGPSVFTAATGNSVSTFNFGNIVDSPLAVVVQGDGSLVQVNTNTNAATTMAGPGTIVSPTSTIGISQWGSQFILICAPQSRGYMIWDGSIFYQSGTIGPSVTISNGGNSYTAAPTITAFGGSGTGAAFSSTITSGGAISTIGVTAAGSGYGASDVVALAFSGGGPGTAATAIAKASITAAGTIGSISVTTKGSGYTGSVTVSIQGGGGIGASATAVAASTGGGITSVSVTNGGQGYTSAPTVIINDVNNPVAEAMVPIMPFGVQGTAIEVYSQRVWISNGDAPSTPPAKSLVQFSAPGNPADFSILDGAGSFLSTDSFLRVGYHSLKQSNGFLYEIGDSSVNYISGVTTSGNPPVTTFNNLNVDPQIGSPWPDTVQVYSRSIVMGNTFGIHAMYGGAVQKVSTPLDGIYTTVPAVGSNPTVGGITPSSAVAIIYGIHVYMQLLPIVDSFTGQQRNALLMWDGQKWWTANPSVTLKHIATQEINSVLTAYGTDGNSVYPLFQTTSSNITKVIQSKLWDTPSIMIKKNSKFFYGVVRSNDNNPAPLTLTIDSEGGSSQQITISNAFSANWTATGGVAANWTATGGLAVTWGATGTAPFGPQNVAGSNGQLMGFTLTTTATDVTLITATLMNQQYQSLT